jgi:serine/threonine-protein phosphatase 2A activator
VPDVTSSPLPQLYLSGKTNLHHLNHRPPIMSDTTLPPALKQISAGSCPSSQLQKRIQTHADLALFHSSPAYTLITAFIVHLNSFVSPLDPITGKLNAPQNYATSSPSVIVSPEVEGIVKLISNLSDLVASAPPDPGPRRFGHVAFRKWLTLAQQHVSQAERVGEYLPSTVLPAKDEILHYLSNSFGSGERLDYGTGHELSFAAFLCCIWVLGGFQPGRDERALVVRAFDAYFKLVRKLVVTYSLEPAGSHGVWGLDDHAFLPYIFGSAQLTTFRPTSDMQAGEADAKAEEAGVPRPADVTKPDAVNRERTRSLYFDAIGFIYDVKKGPFWEHSPILYDISGVQKGWGKINEVRLSSTFLGSLSNSF